MLGESSPPRAEKKEFLLSLLDYKSQKLPVLGQWLERFKCSTVQGRSVCLSREFFSTWANKKHFQSNPTAFSPGVHMIIGLPERTLTSVGASECRAQCCRRSEGLRSPRLTLLCNQNTLGQLSIIINKNICDATNGSYVGNVCLHVKSSS